jgi:4-hydroxy-tetrahydrodipicolinate synthase
VIAGTGSSSTAHAIEMSRKAEAAGADLVMVVVPYYNKPTQAGLVEHYKLVSRAVSCPVIVYNIPGRSGVDLAAESLARIAEACPNVVATKEATGNVLRAQEIAGLLGDRMTVLSGDDGLTVPMMAVGARGVISVTSNLYPREVATVTSLMEAGKLADARRHHLALVPVHAAMFVESNPAPVKYALSWKGRMGHGVRPPLVPLSEEGKKKVVAACETFEKAR